MYFLPGGLHSGIPRAFRRFMRKALGKSKTSISWLMYGRCTFRAARGIDNFIAKTRNWQFNYCTQMLVHFQGRTRDWQFYWWNEEMKVNYFNQMIGGSYEKWDVYKEWDSHAPYIYLVLIKSISFLVWDLKVNEPLQILNLRCRGISFLVWALKVHEPFILLLMFWAALNSSGCPQ